jgi:hypothetical protein
MREPEVKFTPWVRWSERTTLEGVHLPGVYLLSHLNARLVGHADPQVKDVIYIGETCGNSLLERWRQLDRAACRGKRGHSGGLSYRRLFGQPAGNLHVAAFPVSNLDECIRASFIRYIERKLIWEFARKWGAIPECNRK